MATNNAPSMRFPFESQISKLSPEVQQVHRTTWNSITDINQAIAALKTQVDAKTTTGTTSSSSTTTSTASETIINQAGGVTGGVVNNQTGVTTYALAQSDNASLVLLNDSSPIAVTLTSTVTIPYYTTVSNEGTTTATLTPTTGTVNGLASITIPGGGFATLFFDGTNWYADSPGSTAGGVTQIVAGSNVSISPITGIGVVTINSSGGSGGFTSGNNANGYWVIDPIGHIHQWGLVPGLGDDTIGTYSFPIPFTVFASIIMTANDYGHMGGNVRALGCYALSMSQFELTANGNGASAYWIADGY